MTLLSYRKPTLLALGALIAGCAFAAPAAHAQANVTFTGGNGNPLTLTLLDSVLYTVTNTTSNAAPGFALVGTGNFANFSFLGANGTVTYTVNGGPAQTINTINSGFTGGNLTANDGYIFGALSTLAIGDQVLLTAGTLTTTSNFAAAPPASGSFTTFLFDNPGNRISTNGVAVTAAVPEPSQYAMGGMLGASLLFGMVKARRRTSKKAPAAA